MKTPKYVVLSLLFTFLSSSFIFFKKSDIPTRFSSKKIEKALGKVNTKLYASKYEVNNQLYNEFLQELQQNQKTEELKKATIQNNLWNKTYSYGEPMKTHYGSHPAYAEYPVVNITQHGALLFCEWLTDKYNQSTKRRFKKVLFRLPTEAEWVAAAEAGRKGVLFPWGGYYLRNSQGEFLANFKKIDQSNIKYDPETRAIELHTHSLDVQRSNDLVSVKSYYPNDYGLYQMSGNVAEMLQEKGRTKGGSCNSSGYYIRIDAEDEYTGFTNASPDIGFRYFMELLEE